MADDRKKYSGKTAHPLAKLKKRADVTVKELLAKLAIAEANIMTAIVRCQNPAYAKNQRDLYNKIRESYFKLCRQIDQALKSDVASAATDAYHQLEDELGSDGLVRWDEERAKRYWQYVAPEQSQSLAAVYTDKMAESAITSLRQALIETERQASIEGWTMNEKQKALQAKWAGLASRADFQFVDKAGKGWEHARYLQMLTRTTAQRVYNDSYLDRVAENGIKLVRVTALGAPECEVCRAWQGVICSIDGTARGLPSIEAAKSAGVFHPNCVCIHEAVIEEVDKTELAIQRKHPFTKDIRDLDAYEARKFAIDRERYERKGLSAEEARIAVNRDNLELAIRNGLIRSDAREIVDGLTDTQVVALCPDGKTPRFEPLKKGDTAKIVRGSRGGVVHIARNATVKDIIEITKIEASNGIISSIVTGAKKAIQKISPTKQPNTKTLDEIKAMKIEDAIKETENLVSDIASMPIPQSITVREKRLERASQLLESRKKAWKVLGDEEKSLNRRLGRAKGEKRIEIEERLIEVTNKKIKAVKKWNSAYNLRRKIEKKLMSESAPWALQVIAHGKEPCIINIATASSGLPLWNDAKIYLEKIVDKDIFPPDALTIRKLPDGGRAYQTLSKICLSAEDDIQTHIHETMHFVEGKNPHIHNRCVEFLQYRTKGESKKSLRDLTGKNYDIDEYTRPDHFFDPYCGKAYERIDVYGNVSVLSTEILSMGVERLMQNPVRFLQEDREYAIMCLNLIRGNL
jgi:hypothetical protein